MFTTLIRMKTLDDYKNERERLSRQFPEWADRRSPDWTYTGEIGRTLAVYDLGLCTFESLVARSLKSDHGEERATDVYPEGAVCYFRERCTEAANG